MISTALLISFKSRLFALFLLSFVQFSFFEVQTFVLFSSFVLPNVLSLILPNPLRQSH